MRAADVVVVGTSSAGFRVRRMNAYRIPMLSGLLTADCELLVATSWASTIHTLLSLLVPELARIQAFLASPADRLLLLPPANLLL